ncbi:MAG: hypothetical protein BMS9Abin37_1981 [Acidobacteriota bacterium]|nr:MAG: hypothetical protein BMS9Abin37_1981 [Acidobacteriota bacterium]
MLSQTLRSAMVLLVALPTASHALAFDDLPADLVVDVRVFEARSRTPDFKAMEELAFFINSAGQGVTERQWLATIARQATDSFLATLAFESLELDTPTAKLELKKRSRTLRLSLDLSEFASEGIFKATVNGELLRRDEPLRSFEQTIELRLGQTSVWSGRDLELSASEYLSHFRDYSDRDHRGELYDKLRDYTTFLIVALSLRPAGGGPASTDPVTLNLPDDVKLPDLESQLGIELIGTIELELDIDESGTPTDVKIVRSSIPEVNSRILGEAEAWRFPDARGKKGRLVLDLRASP